MRPGHAGAAALLVAMLLAGCATTPQRPVPRVALDQGCASGLEAIVAHRPFVPDPKRKDPPRVQFADVAQCLEVDGARWPVALFDLAGSTAPFTISLRLNGGGGGTLAARAVLLDQGFRRVREFGFGQFTRRGMDYSLTIFNRADQVPVRFLLLEPDNDYVGRTTRYTTGRRYVIPIVTAVAVGSYGDGVESSNELPLTDAGSLQVMVLPTIIETVRD